MKTLIKNGKVLNDDLNGFTARELWIEGDRIIAPPKDGIADKTVDARGRYVLPGLIDIHIHGSAGVHFADKNDYENGLMYCARAGVTSILPTIGVGPLEDLIESIKQVSRQKKRNIHGASIEGIHLEGPFISTEKKGGMRAPHIPSTIENFNALIDAGEGLVKIMTIAPERENALDIITEGIKRGVRMSIGHTMATYDEAMAAINVGAENATHTFNAMRSFGHRDPGVLGAILTDDRIYCEAICDLFHLEPATVKLILKSKGYDKTIIISDTGAMTGLPDGEYTIGGVKKIVHDGTCLTTEGVISGSMSHQGIGAKNLAKLGVPLNEISKMGSYNPAKVIGKEWELGTLAIGTRADIIITDEGFNVERVFTKGAEIV